MSESDLYEAAFGFAVIGGVVMGLLGLAHQIGLRYLARDAPPSFKERAAFHDARIIACLALVPQFSILSLPLIYPTPRDVPVVLGPAAIFVAAMLLCTWIWLLVKLWNAGRLRAWVSFGSLAAICAPLFAVAVFAAAAYVRYHL